MWLGGSQMSATLRALGEPRETDFDPRCWMQRYLVPLRNVLITGGLFWLASWLAHPLNFLFGKLNSGIRYGDSIFSAVAMGVMLSLGWACAALWAGALLTIVAAGRKPERWSFLLAILYVVIARPHSSWVQGPTAWDYIFLGVKWFFPAVACLGGAFLTARLRPSPHAFGNASED
jgi:hypothetical protein